MLRATWFIIWMGRRELPADTKGKSLREVCCSYDAPLHTPTAGKRSDRNKNVDPHSACAVLPPPAEQLSDGSPDEGAVHGADPHNFHRLRLQQGTHTHTHSRLSTVKKEGTLAPCRAPLFFCAVGFWSIPVCRYILFLCRRARAGNKCVAPGLEAALAAAGAANPLQLQWHTTDRQTQPRSFTTGAPAAMLRLSQLFNAAVPTPAMTHVMTDGMTHRAIICAHGQLLYSLQEPRESRHKAGHGPRPRHDTASIHPHVQPLQRHCKHCARRPM